MQPSLVVIGRVHNDVILSIHALHSGTCSYKEENGFEKSKHFTTYGDVNFVNAHCMNLNCLQTAKESKLLIGIFISVLRMKIHGKAVT